MKQSSVYWGPKLRTSYDWQDEYLENYTIRLIKYALCHRYLSLYRQGREIAYDSTASDDCLKERTR